MKEILLVDGYNVVNAWPELIALNDDLEYARDKLVEILAGYGAFKNQQVVVVFDAHAVTGEHQSHFLPSGLEVVFTSEGETADSYIERLSYELVRRGKRVYVVTSDWTEQLVILGVGAYRISARELLQEVKKVKKQIAEGYSENVLTYRRQELEGRLSQEVVKRLEELRKKAD